MSYSNPVHPFRSHSAADLESAIAEAIKNLSAQEVSVSLRKVDLDKADYSALQGLPGEATVEMTIKCVPAVRPGVDF